MMPPGQLDGLTDDEARDLIAYLAADAQVPMRANALTQSLFFDGQSLAMWDADPELWRVESGEIVTLDSRKDGLQAVWSPNSDFLASLDLERECLWIDFVNGLTGCLSLTRLSIPADPASFLVVY